MIGEVLKGRYKVVRLIGEGGMGAVYEARHTGTKRRVALKVITGKGVEDEGRVMRFRREATAAGRIDSDHIAQVFDFDRDDERGFPFMAMELLSGEDLDQLFQRRAPLPPDLAMRLIAQALMGLAKAHEAGVVHRDIKPANIFLATRDGKKRVVKLLDFGIAKLWGNQIVADPDADPSDVATITATGAMVGSPLYMSPEQTRSAKTTGAPSDVWSMGSVFYQALTGAAPFADLESVGSLILAINTDPVEVKTRAPHVPDDIARIIDKSLRIKAEERYENAREMLDALLAILPGSTDIDAADVGAPLASTVAANPPKLDVTEEPQSQVATQTSDASGDDAVAARTRLGATTTAVMSSQPSFSAAPQKRSSTWVFAGVVAVVGAAGYGLTRAPEETSPQTTPADNIDTATMSAEATTTKPAATPTVIPSQLAAATPTTSSATPDASSSKSSDAASSDAPPASSPRPGPSSAQQPKAPYVPRKPPQRKPPQPPPAPTHDPFSTPY